MHPIRKGTHIWINIDSNDLKHFETLRFSRTLQICLIYWMSASGKAIEGKFGPCLPRSAPCELPLQRPVLNGDVPIRKFRATDWSAANWAKATRRFGIQKFFKWSPSRFKNSEFPFWSWGDPTGSPNTFSRIVWNSEHWDLRFRSKRDSGVPQECDLAKAIHKKEKLKGRNWKEPERDRVGGLRRFSLGRMKVVWVFSLLEGGERD